MKILLALPLKYFNISGQINWRIQGPPTIYVIALKQQVILEQVINKQHILTMHFMDEICENKVAYIAQQKIFSRLCCAIKRRHQAFYALISFVSQLSLQQKPNVCFIKSPFVLTYNFPSFIKMGTFLGYKYLEACTLGELLGSQLDELQVSHMKQPNIINSDHKRFPTTSTSKRCVKVNKSRMTVVFRIDDVASSLLRRNNLMMISNCVLHDTLSKK